MRWSIPFSRRALLALLVISPGMAVGADGPARADPAALMASQREDAVAIRAAENAALAQELVAFARAARDPRAMLVAARLLGRESLLLVPAETAPMIVGRSGGIGQMPMTDAIALFAEARELAKGDPDLLAEIAEAQAEANKGIVPGAIAYTHDLGAGRVLVMRARAEGGRIALLRVRSDGDAALSLQVYDPQGKVACSDTLPVSAWSGRRDLVCRWTPDRTGDYRIELSNRGRLWSRAILVSN